MSEPTLKRTPAATKRRPRVAPPVPQSPGPDARVDAQALTFEWDGGDGTDFVVEVSQSDAFEELLARVPTGSSTSVTVYDVFRPDGTTYYWRVVSDAAGPGAVRTFIAATYQELSTPPANDRSKKPDSVLEKAVAAPLTPIDPPYRTAVTSVTEMRIVVIVMLVSFIATLAVLFSLTAQI